MPKKQPRGASEGTIPPIPKDFKSPWIGKRVDNLVRWLKSKPEGRDLDDRHFVVLDKVAKDDPPTIINCRFGDHNAHGDKVFLIRKWPLKAVEHLFGAPEDTWDEWIRYYGNAEIKYDKDAA